MYVWVINNKLNSHLPVIFTFEHGAPTPVLDNQNQLSLTWADPDFDDVSSIEDQLFHHLASHYISCLKQYSNVTGYLYCAVPENIHTPPTEIFFVLHPPPPGNSSLFSYIASKNLALKTHLPPPRFPMTFHGVGMDFFWNYTFYVHVNE